MSLQRLHLTASRFSVCSTGFGSSASPTESSPLRNCDTPPPPSPFFALSGRAIIEIALYGHCVAQSPQPMQVRGSMSISPFGKRAIAPVGHPVRHSGSWQCMQTVGTRTLCSIAGHRLFRPLDMNAATHEPRMAMDLVTSERAIAAANAFRHVHDEQIHAVDDAGLDLFCRGGEDASVCRVLGQTRLFAYRRMHERHDRTGHLRVLAQAADRDLDDLGPAPDGRGVAPFLVG